MSKQITIFFFRGEPIGRATRFGPVHYEITAPSGQRLDPTFTFWGARRGLIAEAAYRAARLLDDDVDSIERQMRREVTP